MTKIEDLNDQEKEEQKLYELGRFGMHSILKDLEKNRLYEQPLLLGLLDTLISSTFKRIGNDELTLHAISYMTASSIRKNKIKH